MAILVTVTFFKPTAETKLYNQDNENAELSGIFAEEKLKYKISGKLLSERMDRTEDGLQLTYAALWKSQEDYDDYMKNEILHMFWAERRKHNFENGITHEKKITEV
jgi:hypothetical protein